MNIILLIALTSTAPQAATTVVEPQYPCHFRQANCPPPPPIEIPAIAHETCANQKKGSKFIWMLSPDKALVGSCQKQGRTLKFVPLATQ